MHFIKSFKANSDNIITGFILIAGAMVFPLFFICPFTYYKTVQMFFSLSSISLICFGIILFKAKDLKDQLIKKHWGIFVFACLFLVIPIIQYFTYKTYTISELSFSIMWITIPLFAYLYSEQLKKQLPAYFFIFLLFNLFISILQADVSILKINAFLSALQANEIVGIAGNRNWHAVFLIPLNAFSIYFAGCIYKTFSKKSGKIFSAFILIIIFGTTTIFSIYIMAICKCKAAWIALIAVSLLMIFLELFKKNRKAFTVMLIFTMLLIGTIYGMNKLSYKELPKTSTIVLKIQSKDKAVIQKMDKTIRRDVRFPLWEGCVDMIMKYPYFGVSTARFESVFAEFRPIEYFMKPNNAVRSNHPHNSFLYITACYGIPGFILWLTLWGFPVIICLWKYYKLSLFSKITLFCYTILFLHALLDLIFFEWPTVLFSAILLGILWTEAWGKTVDNLTKKEKLLAKIIFTALKLTAIAVLAISIKIVYMTLVSTYYFRIGETAELCNHKEEALYYYDKGIKLDKAPSYVYRAGAMAFHELKNPQLSLHYFLMFKGMPISNYAHSNGFTGLALIKLNKMKESLPYLLKEVVIYPFLVGSWYRLYYVQEYLGMKKASQISYNNMQEVLKQKNLPPKALYFLLENPDYDSHPDRIPPDVMAKLQE